MADYNSKYTGKEHDDAVAFAKGTNNIGTTKLQDGAVTLPKLASAVKTLINKAIKRVAIITSSQTNVALTITTNEDNATSVIIPKATNANAGVMTADDKKKLDGYEQKIAELEGEIKGGSVEETLTGGRVYTGMYMAGNNRIYKSSSGANIIIFPCCAGDTYKISIPKSNNSAGYYFGYSETGGGAEDDVVIVDPGCKGTLERVEHIVAAAENYPYIVIGYVAASGTPTVVHLYELSSDLVKKKDLDAINNEIARNEGKMAEIEEDVDETKRVMDATVNAQIVTNNYNGTTESGYVSSSGGFSHTAPNVASGLIPVKGNKYYYVQRPFVNGKSAPNIRVLAEDGVTPMKVLVASTGQEYSNWYQPNETGDKHSFSSQIKIPNSGAFLQFTMWFSSVIPTSEELDVISKVMIEEVGDSYAPDFVPSSYIEAGTKKVTSTIKDSALENSRVIQSTRKSLKVLFIGNSFLDASINYAPFILYNIAPDVDVTFVELVKGGSSLEDWYKIFTGQDTTSVVSPFIFKRGSTKWEQPILVGESLKAKVEYIVKMYDYDAIVFQQVSYSVDQYKTYQPFLNNLIKMVFNIVNHPVKLGWLLTPTNGSDYDVSVIVFNNILDAVKKVVDETAIEFIIPCGTAFQNARTTSMRSLGVDGNLIQNSHPQAGLPCQILSYALVLKVFDLMGMNALSVYGENTRVNAAWQEGKGLHDLQGLTPNLPVDVTDEYARVAQICAMVANKNPFVVTDCARL